MPTINTIESARQALVEQQRRRTKQQQERYEWVTRRNRAIQEHLTAPPDGVVFGKKGKS